MKIRFTLFNILLSIFSLQLLNAQSWEEQAIGILPINYGVFDISIVDENIVWAVAFDQNTISNIPLNHITKVLKTVDGGLTWESFDVEEAEGRISFDIEAFDANTAFITTQDYNNGSGRGVFKTEDGGDTWAEKFNHVAAGVWIRFFNEQEGVIINRQSIATTQDGGESWQLVSSSNIPSFSSNEYTILSTGNNSCQVIGDHIWFGTSKGRVYRSKDKGHTWDAFDTSLGSNALILSIAFRDTLNGIALDATSSITSFAETTNGGEAWDNIVSSPEISIANIEYVLNTDSVLIGTSDIFTPSSDRVSAYSTDFGKSWEIINTNIPFGGTEFLSPTVGWTSRGEITSSNQPAMYKWVGDIFVSSDDFEAYTKIGVFPNPVSTQLQIKLSDPTAQTLNLTIEDVNGKIVKKQTFQPGQPLDVADLVFGMYFLKIETNGISYFAKFVKM